MQAPSVIRGIDRDQIEPCKQQGIAYIISIPALLYIAHTKWINRVGEPLDDHTRYYCERDVDRHLQHLQHLQRWQKAAAEKKVYQFQLPLEDATIYLPKYFDDWRSLLPENPEQDERP